MPFDRNISVYSTRRVREDGDVTVPDSIAVEEPLRIFVQNQPMGFTLRTPGDDIALAAGWCLTGGWIEHPDDIVSVHHAESSETNDVFVELTEKRWYEIRDEKVGRLTDTNRCLGNQVDSRSSKIC